MLANLALYLLFILTMCALILLICWAYDTDRAENEAGRSRPADLEFPVPAHKRRSHVRLPAPGLPERRTSRASTGRSARSRTMPGPSPQPVRRLLAADALELGVPDAIRQEHLETRGVLLEWTRIAPARRAHLDRPDRRIP
jgi:hypothetical protein